MADISPIMESAVASNQTENIKRLVESGIPLEAKNNEGKTAMFIAAMLGNIESIECLAKLGANVNAVDNAGLTPIFIAAMAGKTASIKCLVKLGADINAKERNDCTPIFVAIFAGQTESVKCLKELGADLNAIAGNGMNLMETAKAAGHSEDSEVFRVLKSLLGTIFTDPRDGKTYKTVTIGKQTWMAENLNYEASSSKVYDNNSANVQKYGRLYNWETAKMACPLGWHLPSDKEWQELVDFAGGEKIAGKKLKATSGWVENGNGTDEYGFAALPGGYCRTNGMFQFVGSFGGWLSSTEENSENVFYRNVGYEQTDIFKYTIAKTTFFSVRCIKD